MSVSDAGVIQSSLEDPVRFAVIFDRHVDPIRRFAVSRLGSSRSEDVVSEVFRIAFEQRDTFDLTSRSARPWLFGIATNLVRREHRSHARAVAALERLGGRRHITIDPLLDVADRVDAREDVLRLRDAVLALSDDEREILLLVAWDQLTPSEAALALGWKPETARTRLRRARLAVRRHLAGEPISNNDSQEVQTDATR